MMGDSEGLIVCLAGGQAMEHRCRECGEERSVDVPGGMCPACLRRADLAGGTPAEADQDWHDSPDRTAGWSSPPSSLAATSAPARGAADRNLRVRPTGALA